MLKLNVGFTKKIGEANYGSRGACVNLELELDSGLVGDADRLKERIRQLFTLAKASVDEELAVTATKEPPPNEAPNEAPTNGRHSNGNGASADHSHGGERRRDNTRPATASQVRALLAITARRKLDLETLLAERFGTRDPAETSIVEASQLIDELKGSGHGAGGRR